MQPILKKWLIAAGIVFILAAAFIWGGNSPQPGDGGGQTAAEVAEQPRASGEAEGAGNGAANTADSDAGVDGLPETGDPSTEGRPSEVPVGHGGTSGSGVDGAGAVSDSGDADVCGGDGDEGGQTAGGANGEDGGGADAGSAGAGAPTSSSGTSGAGAGTGAGSGTGAGTGAGKPAVSVKQGSPVKPSSTPTAKPVKPAATPASTKDEYGTEPVPSGKPAPVEWQDAEIDKTKTYTATLSVSAATILNNLKLFDEDKLEVLPDDGVIYSARKVTFYEGESVFDVLLREMKKSKIHMEFEMTPIYNSHYIEGINNIYEFDCGELSGWMYKVNGWFPNYGSSRYQLEDGDVIEWVYTCDLGRDVGDAGAAGRNAS